MNEFELIQTLTRSLPTNKSVVVGPGDDCAVIALHPDDELAVLDLHAERFARPGRHHVIAEVFQCLGHWAWVIRCDDSR